MDDKDAKQMIGDRIASARKIAGLTQGELGEKCGIHLQTVSKWERGIHTPNADELLKIATVTNSSPNFLLGYSDEIIYKRPSER